jgi:uncharacterized membrane protein
MKKNLALSLFVFVELSVLAFIVATAGMLPDVVASHFNSAGLANGFMPKKVYLVLVSALSLVIPLTISGSMALISRLPESAINIPNKKIWLSPAYRESTFAYLRAHSLGMGGLMSLLMGYVHWLVIQANTDVPAHMSSQAMGGAVVFVVALLGWVAMLLLKFMRQPQESK